MSISFPQGTSTARLVPGLKAQLFEDATQRVYALLDGASIPDLLPKLAEYTPEHACLYRGELSQSLAECAPYLITLEPDAPFTEWLLKEGWGNHWGIFATSREPLNAVRIHFRKYLMVIYPDGRRLYFRYYDPRVFRAYLPTCNAEELSIVFGPVRSFCCESEGHENAFFYHKIRDDLKITPIDLYASSHHAIRFAR